MKMTFPKNSSRWTISILISLLMAGLLSTPDTSHGAAITWGPATAISGDSDVINAGTLLYAYDWGASSNVNAVGFTELFNTGAGSSISALGFYDVGSSYFSSGSAPFSTLSPQYQSILMGGLYSVGGSPVPVTVTLTGLTIGHGYSVQVWVNDPRGPENGRSKTITSPGGSTNTLRFSMNSLMSPGGPGQYTVGTFTANATTQSFTLTGNSPDNVTQMNAVQVRDNSIQAQPVWRGIQSTGPGAVKLIFTGPSGAHFTLLTTTNVGAAGPWTPLPSGAGTFAGIPVTNLDGSATNADKFYRISSP
jgi:hypothetical protein